MKILFGLYHRYEVGFTDIVQSNFMAKYHINFDGRTMPLSDDICASCMGCVAFNEDIKRFLCATFATEINPWDAESPDIPCSKYRRVKFKKL